jgi:predicted dehydrogenase
MSFKMAIIGMGGMADWHYRNISNGLDFITVAGAYDIREEACEGIKSRGLRLYESPSELLADKSLDVVLIATPNNFHKDYSISCLKAGHNVICEKPATMNSAELEEIISVSKDTGKFFTTHQNRRWDTDFLTLKSSLEQGLLEKPFRIESRVQGSRGMFHGWRCFRLNGGGMVLDWGVHLIDQLFELFNEPIVEIGAHLHNVIADEVEDEFTAEFRFESGLSCLVNVSMNCFAQQPRWHACSRNGSMVIENWDAEGRIIRNKSKESLEWTDTIVYTSAGPTRSMAPRPTHTMEEIPLPVTKQDCFKIFYTNIDDRLNNKADLLVKPEQTMRVMKAIDYVFQADAGKMSVSCRL